MSSKPLFSIITVVRNDRAGIKKTFRSLSQQKTMDFEWIVIDGSSTDGTDEYMRSLQTIFRVKFVSEPDAGIFDAMNKGIDKADGLYLSFLNAGDCLADHSTLQTVKNIILVNPDLIFGDCYQSSGEGDLVLKPARSSKWIRYGMFASHQSMYYRASSLGDLRYNTTFRCSGDYDFTARFLARTRSIIAINAPLCIFDMTGFSEKNRSVGRRENWRVHRDVLKLNLASRLFVRLIYHLTSNIRDRLPVFYRRLRAVKNAS